MFDNLESLFQNWRSTNEPTKSLVTLSTALGIIVIVLVSLKFLINLAISTQLYVINRLCYKKDLPKKYGKWAVITGSTDGIGLAMAKELAQKGFSILIVGRNEDKLTRTKATIQEEPNVGEVETIQIDLSDQSPENFERFKERLDPDNRDIGILINNAGISHGTLSRYGTSDMEITRRVINTNILAVLYITRMVLPGMVERQRGLVLNVSSQAGYMPLPYWNIYATTKTFINRFTEILQIEYDSYPIDIVCLTPGAVETKLYNEVSKLRGLLMIPTPQTYAKSAIDALSTPVRAYCGYFVHGIFMSLTFAMESLGLQKIHIWIFRVLANRVVNDLQLSPVPKRKKQTPTS